MRLKANAHPLLTDKGDPLIFWALDADNQILKYVYEFYMLYKSVCGREESGGMEKGGYRQTLKQMRTYIQI